MSTTGIQVVVIVAAASVVVMVTDLCCGAIAKCLLSKTNYFVGIERKHAVLNGVKYSYFYSSPTTTTQQPTLTFLFIHGFPDTAYGWRHQLSYFANLGHTVIAPDMLGYNETETPENLERYSRKHVCGT